jgi:hypothetical protein
MIYCFILGFFDSLGLTPLLLLLSIGAMVSKTTQSTILMALESVTTPMIKAWADLKIGITIQAQKKELYSHV